MGSKVDNIVTEFRVKVLPPIIRELEYEKINKIVQCLYGNIATLPTTLGRGRHGHIRLIINLTLYATITQTLYAAPAEPSTVPNTPGTVMEAECAQQQDQKIVVKRFQEKPHQHGYGPKDARH